MSETQKDTQQSTKKSAQVADSHKVGLVELIMILLLVGLVFVFMFGMRQLKIDKEAEALAQTKFAAVLPTMQKAIDAAEAFKKADEFGDYPFDISQLNLGNVETEDFTLEYNGENYSIIAITKDAFGKAGIKVIYMLNERGFQIEDPAPERKPTIKDEWLPQE